MYSDKVKVSSIYYNQTSESHGKSSGSVVGISSGGLGVGSISGTTQTITQSKLAEMFSPLKNHSIGDDTTMQDLFMATGCLWSATNFNRVLRFFEFSTSSELVINIGTGLSAVVSFYFLIRVLNVKKNTIMKYTEDEMNSINSRYNEVYYSPKHHVIFIDEKTPVPATRNDLISLLVNPKNSSDIITK